MDIANLDTNPTTCLHIKLKVIMIVKWQCRGESLIDSWTKVLDIADNHGKTQSEGSGGKDIKAWAWWQKIDKQPHTAFIHECLDLLCFPSGEAYVFNLPNQKPTFINLSHRSYSNDRKHEDWTVNGLKKIIIMKEKETCQRCMARTCGRKKGKKSNILCLFFQQRIKLLVTSFVRLEQSMPNLDQHMAWLHVMHFKVCQTLKTISLPQWHLKSCSS